MINLKKKKNKRIEKREGVEKFINYFKIIKETRANRIKQLSESTGLEVEYYTSRTKMADGALCYLLFAVLV